MIKQIFSTAILLFFGAITAFSQFDTPCATTPLVLGTSCVPVVHDAIVNTQSAIPNPSCDGYYPGYANEDTWYSFIAPASGLVNVAIGQVAGGDYPYMSAAVYTGPCASLTAAHEVDCFGGPPGSAFPVFDLSGLTPGQTYYVRVWGIDFSLDGDPRTHSFCAYEPATPPSNDECDNAIAATVDTTGYCDITNPGTINGATESSESYFCSFAGGGDADDDVWFSFVALATTHYLFLNDITGSTSDLSMSVHEGTYCNSSTGTSTCISQDFATGLTVGNTYYVRVWSNSSTPETSTFNLCITTPPAEPACAVNPDAGNTACTATPICNINGYCGTTSATYTNDSWTELDAQAGSCFPDIDNNSFLELTAIESKISFWVWVDNCGTGNGIQIMVFSASNCGSGPVTVHECYSPGNVPIAATLITAEGLTSGDDYYIMIDGNAGDVCDYKIAAYEGIEVPVSVSTSSATSNICLGESIDMIAAGGANGSYTWSPATDLSSTTNDTVTSTPPATGSYTYTASSTSVSTLCPTTMNDFTFIVDPCTLPIDLIKFDARCGLNKVMLNWSTASENNNDYFTIERSDGVNPFTPIVNIPGNGNSSTLINYSWNDEQPLTGTAYYRLKQTDFNGKIQYFEVSSNNCDELSEISIYPNPFENSFTLQLSGKLTYPVSVEVLDYTGRIVLKQLIETQSTEIVLDDYAVGTYFLKVITPLEKELIKCVKMN